MKKCNAKQYFMIEESSSVSSSFALYAQVIQRQKHNYFSFLANSGKFVQSH